MEGELAAALDSQGDNPSLAGGRTPVVLERWLTDHIPTIGKCVADLRVDLRQIHILATIRSGKGSQMAHDDAIEQDDARRVSGANGEYELNRRWGQISFKSTLGAQIRRDDAHVDLWNITARGGVSRKRLGRHVG